MDAVAGRAERAQGLLDGVHERLRAAHEGLTVGVRGEHGRQPVHGGQALEGLQPVDHEQPVRVVLGQRPQFVAEDDRGLVAVGVQQHHPAPALGQRRFGDRQDRRDAAASGDEQQVIVEESGVKVPAGGSTSSSSPAASRSQTQLEPYPPATRLTVIFRGSPVWGELARE